MKAPPATNADTPPRYLPAASLKRIRLIDIFRSAREAEDEGQTDSFRSDAPVSGLLRDLDQQFESQLAEQSLADFIARFEIEDPS